MTAEEKANKERTELLQHFVTLIQHEMFDILQAEGLAPDQSEDTAWRSDHNVRAVFLQDFFILLDGKTAEEHCGFYSGHILGETLVLFADLEGQLSCVAHD